MLFIISYPKLQRDTKPILLVFSDISQKVNEPNLIEEIILRYEHKANRSQSFSIIRPKLFLYIKSNCFLVLFLWPINFMFAANR